MFTHREHALKRAARYIAYCPIQNSHFNNFKAKFDQNIHHNALNCTFSSKFSWGECMPPNHVRSNNVIISIYKWLFLRKFKTVQ